MFFFFWFLHTCSRTYTGKPNTIKNSLHNKIINYRNRNNARLLFCFVCKRAVGCVRRPEQGRGKAGQKGSLRRKEDRIRRAGTFNIKKSYINIMCQFRFSIFNSNSRRLRITGWKRLREWLSGSAHHRFLMQIRYSCDNLRVDK